MSNDSDDKWDPTDAELRAEFEALQAEIAACDVENGTRTAGIAMLGPTVSVVASGGFVTVVINEEMARRIHGYLGRWLESADDAAAPPFIPTDAKIH